MNGYDELEPDEQARLRARWSEGIDRLAGGLDLRSEFEAAETSYSELDGAGRVVTRYPRTKRSV